MNVSHPDEFEESQGQDDLQASEDLTASDQQVENAPAKAAQLMERSASNPVIINK